MYYGSDLTSLIGSKYTQDFAFLIFFRILFLSTSLSNESIDLPLEINGSIDLKIY